MGNCRELQLSSDKAYGYSVRVIAKSDERPQLFRVTVLNGE